MMPHDLTHASFFSGVGGLDLGLERAGWRTVSFSEIDPYASAVLAERWPGVPNLGDITQLTDLWPGDCEVYGCDNDANPDDHEGLCSRCRDQDEQHERLAEPNTVGGYCSPSRREQLRAAGDLDWEYATLWTGGFPCQDLSVAGKRAGMGTEDDRTRSGLAYAFLDLVERHRPTAILLENVPGLLSSNGGKDLGALLGRLGELGYWWAYRILDAQFFGVPQRRRRVFICALHAGAGFGADSPAAVLSVGARCGGHSQESDQEGQGATSGVAPGADIAFNPTAGSRSLDDGPLSPSLKVGSGIGVGWAPAVFRPSPDSGGVREADGLAGRSHHREVVGTLRVGAQKPGDGGPGDTVPIVQSLPTQRVGTDDNDAQAGFMVIGGEARDDSLLPLGLDSHRYRCAGNGVVSLVSEWIGERLAQAVRDCGVQS